jgi:phosphinothricin acetyltransferase
MRSFIRLASPADAKPCLAIYAPVVRDSAISFEIEPPKLGEMRHRIADYLKHAPWLCYEQDGQVAGYAYASQFRPRLAYRWSVEGSFYLAPEVRGRGIGFALGTVLVQLLKLQGFDGLFGAIALPNPASERMSEKLGMRRVGVLPRAGFKLGRWHDVAYWHMELSESTPTPEEPKTPAECAGTPEWQAALDTANSLLAHR